MTQEEKARAYDEALKKIQPLYEQAKKDDNPIWSTYEYLIPELCESEDERIRKALIQFLNDIKSISESGRTSWAVRKEDAEMCNSFITYLEKQKESKHAPDDLQKSFEAGQTSIVDNPEQYGLCKKAEWSEEDEKMRNLAIEWAETMYGQFRFVDMGSTNFRKIVAWLKSLRPSWKPSDKDELMKLKYAGTSTKLD